jgi:hypothetical protein
LKGPECGYLSIKRTYQNAAKNIIYKTKNTGRAITKPVRISEQFLVKPEPKFFTVEALRSYMESVYGYSLSKSRIYALTMNGEIPHIKGPGGRLLSP